MPVDDRMKRWYENAVICQIPAAVFQESTGNDWMEAVADHAYEQRPTGERRHLHGYRYRWLTAAAHSGTAS